MRKNRIPTLSLILAVWLVLAACAQPAASPTATAAEPATSAPTPEDRVLTVMTHDSFQVSEPVVAAFEAQEGVQVRFLKSGDTGTALNKAILSRDNPLADVFYGVDNTFLSRALAEDIFEPYESPLLEVIPIELQLDPQHRALPVDFGDVCLNYDKTYFEAEALAPPENLDDLLDPAYSGLLVVENPATSSPGLAFLLATISRYGQDGYLDYWRGLLENDVLVVNDWEAAYYSEFSLWGGSRPVVVSYSSSPPAEVIFAEEPIDAPSSAAVVADGSCFRQIEFVGILVGTPHRDLAEKWVDFMLSPTFQEDMPLNMFVFPVHPEAAMDDAFVRFMAIPEVTAQVDPQLIAEQREAWIQAWTDVVLR